MTSKTYNIVRKFITVTLRKKNSIFVQEMPQTNTTGWQMKTSQVFFNKLSVPATQRMHTNYQEGR